MQHRDRPALARAQQDDASLEEARWHARLHAGRIENAIRIIHGENFLADAKFIRARLAARFLKRTPQAMAKRGVAAHHAGQFIALEAEGLRPGMAKISVSPFERLGWTGRVDIHRLPGIDHRAWADDPNEFLRLARTMPAGPLAEALYADGDILSAMGGLTVARLLVARAAELSGRDKDRLFHEALFATARLVERQACEIEEIANVLERMYVVDRRQPCVRNILERVQRSPTASVSVSKRSKALVRLVEAEVPNTEEILGAHQS